MRNHSPFLLQTIKQNNMSKNLKQNKMDIKTYIPNQQKSSFTNYRKYTVDIINRCFQKVNNSLNNQSEKISYINFDTFKTRQDFNNFLIEFNKETENNYRQSIQSLKSKLKTKK